MGFLFLFYSVNQNKLKQFKIPLKLLMVLSQKKTGFIIKQEKLSLSLIKGIITWILFINLNWTLLCFSNHLRKQNIRVLKNNKKVKAVDCKFSGHKAFILIVTFFYDFKTFKEYIFFFLVYVCMIFIHRPLHDNMNLWKGVLSSGKTGLFNPAHTVAYFANFPTTRPSFSRADSKSGIYASKRRYFFLIFCYVFFFQLFCICMHS